MIELGRKFDSKIHWTRRLANHLNAVHWTTFWAILHVNWIWTFELHD